MTTANVQTEIEVPPQPVKPAPAAVDDAPAGDELVDQLVDMSDDDETPSKLAELREYLADRALTAARRAASIRLPIRRWWWLTTRPRAIAVTWRLSGKVDRDRIPLGSWGLRVAWRWANRTERVLIFALVMLLPSFAQGPLLWAAEKPSRRAGLWIVAALLLGTLLIARA